MRYILALDQGTTSSRAIVFDREGRIAASAQREFRQHFPQPGWVEHDPLEIWESQEAVTAEALTRAGLACSDIAAIGITNQRETTVIWERATGMPICNAIVWQDRRTAGLCDELKRDGLEPLIQARTGLVIDAYFSATKIRWMLDNIPGARVRAERGDLAFGTIDSWLIWNLTRGARHITDCSNASRTMLFNLKSCEWDGELLERLQIPRSILPEVVPSSVIYGEYNGIPIAGMAGDQQAALFGQACLEPGMVKNTYGTGCFMLMCTGFEPRLSQYKLLSTVAWNVGSRTTYALEGGVFAAGAVVQWLRDGLGLIHSSAEVERLAQSVPDNGGVYFVPAFAGLGAPHWDQHARGMITGLTRGATAGHIARAALEGIAFQVADVLSAMKSDSESRLRELRVDGGASTNDLLMQFQADLLDVSVVRPAVSETTALGAAYLAGLAVGYWKGLPEIAGQWRAERRFEPSIAESERTRLLDGWNNALQRAKSSIGPR